MTRINIIPPKELYDQHLIAEYREITMVPAALKKTLCSKQGLILSKIPKTYTLNTGHVYFFYNKGKYLNNRYHEIILEMRNRGFKPNKNRLFPKEIFINNNLYNDWKPSKKDYEVIRKRIKQKLDKRPNWYRKTIHEIH
tara:strand:+ start:806 stop:1222 length:417 start_codon:yes stop_codon:yes gene_type:complete